MNALEQFLRLISNYPLNRKENLNIRRTLALTTRFAAEDILHVDGQALYSYCIYCELFIVGQLPTREIQKRTNSILFRNGKEFYCPICEEHVF